jgi:hypothetical protein
VVRGQSFPHNQLCSAHLHGQLASDVVTAVWIRQCVLRGHFVCSIEIPVWISVLFLVTCFVSPSDGEVEL